MAARCFRFFICLEKVFRCQRPNAERSPSLQCRPKANNSCHTVEERYFVWKAHVAGMCRRDRETKRQVLTKTGGWRHRCFNFCCPYYTANFTKRKFRPRTVTLNILLSALSVFAISGNYCIDPLMKAILRAWETICLSFRAQNEVHCTLTSLVICISRFPSCERKGSRFWKITTPTEQQKAGKRRQRSIWKEPLWRWHLEMPEKTALQRKKTTPCRTER